MLELEMKSKLGEGEWSDNAMSSISAIYDTSTFIVHFGGQFTLMNSNKQIDRQTATIRFK